MLSSKSSKLLPLYRLYAGHIEVMQSFLHNFYPLKIFAQFGKEVRFLPHVEILSFNSRQKIILNWQTIGWSFLHLTKWTQQLFVNCEPWLFLQSCPAITVWLFSSTILFSFTKVWFVFLSILASQKQGRDELGKWQFFVIWISIAALYSWTRLSSRKSGELVWKAN